jgi:hypothetical protein
MTYEQKLEREKKIRLPSAKCEMSANRHRRKGISSCVISGGCDAR